MRLTINLATRTYLDKPRLNLIFAFITLVLVIALFINVQKISSCAGETSRVRGELEALDRKAGIARKPVVEQDYQNLVAHIRFANKFILRKTFSWLTLFDQLEAVVPDGVALTRIEPDAKEKGLVKFSGTTQSFSKLKSLLENMEQSQSFSEIYLLTHADTKVGETQKGVSFTITCQVKML